MPKFFNESNPVVKQKLEISEMGVEVEQLKQAIQLLAEEGDKEFRAVNETMEKYVESFYEDYKNLNKQYNELLIQQQKTQKVCVIMLILTGVSLVSSLASLIF